MAISRNAAEKFQKLQTIGDVLNVNNKLSLEFILFNDSYLLLSSSLISEYSESALQPSFPSLDPQK